MGRRVNDTQKKRKCHDCGKPCNDYRCKKCWDKVRKDNASDGSDVDCYKVSFSTKNF